MNRTVHTPFERIVLLMMLMIGGAVLCWHLASSGYLAMAEFRRGLRMPTSCHLNTAPKVVISSQASAWQPRSR